MLLLFVVYCSPKNENEQFRLAPPPGLTLFHNLSFRVLTTKVTVNKYCWIIYLIFVSLFRIYSKFHARRMAELSESGLHHFLLLFLVLAHCGDLEDAAGRACDLLNTLAPGAASPTLCALQWRGQLAMLLLFSEHGLDLAPLSSKLALTFTQTAREFYLKTTEPSRRTALWLPLSAYLEGTAELWQTSASLCQSEEALLGEGFSLLLPACRTAELNTALSFLQTMLTQLW